EVGDVIAGFAGGIEPEVVIAIATAQGIDTCAAIERIVTFAAIQRVLTSGTDENVIPVAAGDCSVSTVKIDQDIAAVSGFKRSAGILINCHVRTGRLPA